MDDRQGLMDALKFHGHKCWASVAGVRVGLAALAYMRFDGTRHVCISCSGYDR
jgi:formylmethanofuran dehydrogenase subunit E